MEANADSRKNNKTPSLTKKCTTEVSRLPLPDIRDEMVSQNSFHPDQRREYSRRLRPPKLNLNRSHPLISTSTSAQAISFRGEFENTNLTDTTADTLLLSTCYDHSLNETYFEQCFTRLEKIGEGSFGEVFKVKSKEDGLLYAVKMSKQLFRSGSYRQERLEEVRRYEEFSGHSNCVRFYRAWEQNDRLYMQMELCRESLERYLDRNQRIPEKKIWCILLDLLLALKSLHDRNLIHLDIKLDNVLIGDDGSCKLADFGLVIDVDTANRQQTEGDSRYIAPEILQGNFSKAADIFSLGIAMLELSCYLTLPSNGPLWQQLRSGILPEDFIKHLSTELQTIIKQMMTPNPLLRPTVDQLLAHKIFVAMLHQRTTRWELKKKLQRSIWNSRRFVLSKWCYFKFIVFAFFAYFVSTIKSPEPIKTKPMETTEMPINTQNGKAPIPHTHLISSTPTTCNLLQTDICFDLSQQGTPNNFAADELVNSTPLFSDSVHLHMDSLKPDRRPQRFRQALFQSENRFHVTDVESVLNMRKRLFSNDSD